MPLICSREETINATLVSDYIVKCSVIHQPITDNTSTLWLMHSSHNSLAILLCDNYASHTLNLNQRLQHDSSI